MPYNTRRKSVSLSSLGIHVPRSPKASAAQRSPPATTSLVSESQPPLKKLKRSHTLQESLNPSHQSVAPDYKHERPQARVFDTPPPSPGGESRHFKVEIEGINDDIVVAVIEQLESTGNRPHLLKELAAILSNHIPIVQSSANQPAIISSRLSTFMKRQWTAQSPCPIGKELIGTHPKRIFFYLSQQPHQPFPEPADTLAAQHRIISPSLTSAENEEEDDRNTRKRDEMSPSPEVELDSPLLDDTDSHLAHHSFPTLLAHAPSHERSKPLSHGRTSPPLERDEREFTQTASSLQQRRRSETKELEAKDIPAPTTEASDEPMIEADESEESAALRNKEAAEQLFGHADRHLPLPKAMYMESSPMLKPQLHLELTYQRHIEMRDVHHLTQEADLFCENVGLDELDDLFSSY